MIINKLGRPYVVFRAHSVADDDQHERVCRLLQSVVNSERLCEAIVASGHSKAHLIKQLQKHYNVTHSSPAMDGSIST